MQLYFILVAAGCVIVNASPSNMEKLDAVAFPDSLEDDVPEPCRNLTYCTIPPKNYPFKEFNEMFKFYKYIPQPQPVLPPVISINTRGEFDDDCETKVTYDPLYKVRQKRGNEWQLVMQAPEHDYIQRVRLEICKYPGASCFNRLEELQDSYSTYCLQKYNVWKVLVHRPGSEPEEIEVDLPVCCSCHYKPKQLV